MTTETIVLTVVAPDRPGIVQQLSDVIRAQEGNWLESSLSRLGGQFAGVVSISVATSVIKELTAQLNQLSTDEIHIKVHQQLTNEEESLNNVIDIEVEANDRPGIVEEISTALANKSINVEKITTSCESASMAGYNLFKATLKVALRDNMTAEDLEAVLEDVSDDVMVTIVS